MKNVSYFSFYGRFMASTVRGGVMALGMGALLLAGNAAMADTTESVWSGAASTSWASGVTGNWSNGVPSSSISAEFNGTFTNQPTLAGSETAQGIWVTGSGNTGVSGLTTISGGHTFNITGSATLDGISGVGILLDGTGNNNLTITTSGFVTVLGGSTSFLVNNGGTLSFTTGITIANASTLTLGATTSSGTGSITLSGNFDTTTASTGGITISDTNGATTTVSFSGTADYTGATAINSGSTFNLAGSGILGAGASGGTAISSAGTFTENSSAVIEGVSSISVTTGTTTLNGFNSYTGGTSISGGTLVAGAAGALGSTTGSLTINGGIVDLHASQTVGSLNGTSGGTILDNGSTSSILTASSGTYSGVIEDNTSGTGTISLTKIGSGSSLTLTGNSNTYSGGTTISAGVLQVLNTNSSSSATGTGGVALGAATLRGTGYVSGLVTASGASGGSIITAATTASIGNLTLNGGVTGTTGLTLNLAIDGTSGPSSTLTLGSAGLTITGGLTFDLFDLGKNVLVANTPYTLITGTGAVTADSVTVNLMNSGYTLNTTYGAENGVLISGDNVTFEVVAGSVPEPSTYAMLLGGFGVLLIMQRLRSRGHAGIA